MNCIWSTASLVRLSCIFAGEQMSEEGSQCLILSGVHGWEDGPEGTGGVCLAIRSLLPCSSESSGLWVVCFAMVGMRQGL